MMIEYGCRQQLNLKQKGNGSNMLSYKHRWKTQLFIGLESIADIYGFDPITQPNSNHNID